jgi:hypothetical protein
VRNGSRKSRPQEKKAENPTLENRQGCGTQTSKQRPGHPSKETLKRKSKQIEKIQNTRKNRTKTPPLKTVKDGSPKNSKERPGHPPWPARLVSFTFIVRFLNHTMPT